MSKKNGSTPEGTTTKSHLNSTSTTSQRQRLLEWLTKFKVINTYEGREHLNIESPAARILELRKLGHIIHTVKVTAKNRDGFIHHGIASYVLIKLAGTNNE